VDFLVDKILTNGDDWLGETIELHGYVTSEENRNKSGIIVIPLNVLGPLKEALEKVPPTEG